MNRHAKISKLSCAIATVILFALALAITLTANADPQTSPLHKPLFSRCVHKSAQRHLAFHARIRNPSDRGLSEFAVLLLNVLSLRQTGAK